MNENERPVLTAVAYPSTVLYVPTEVAGLIVAGHAFLMALSAVFLGLNPVIFLVTITACWIAGFAAFERDPHVVSLLQAAGKFKRKTRNIVPSRGVKYVP